MRAQVKAWICLGSLADRRACMPWRLLPLREGLVNSLKGEQVASPLSPKIPAQRHFCSSVIWIEGIHHCIFLSPNSSCTWCFPVEASLFLGSLSECFSFCFNHPLTLTDHFTLVASSPLSCPSPSHSFPTFFPFLCLFPIPFPSHFPAPFLFPL